MFQVLFSYIDYNYIKHENKIMLLIEIYLWIGVEQQLVYIGWGTLLIQATQGFKTRFSKN